MVCTTAACSDAHAVLPVISSKPSALSHPTLSCAMLQELYERVVILADKYNMSGVLQCCVQRLCEADAAYSLDPAAPNFVLR